MHTFKNLHPTDPMGVNTVAQGTIYVPPGQTSPALDVAGGELKYLKTLKHFEIASGSAEEPGGEGPKGVEDGSIANSTAHRDGKPVIPAALAPKPAGADGGSDIDFEKLSDEELRAYITDRDGRAPHSATGREKLLAKAKDATAKEEEAV